MTDKKEMKDGNTSYEVVSHFNSNDEEYFINQYQKVRVQILVRYQKISL